MSPAVPSREVRISRPPDRCSPGDPGPIRGLQIRGRQIRGRQVQVGQQGGRVAGGRGEVRARQQQAALGQRRDGHPVPGRDHLVVAARADPGAARGQQGVADPGQALRVGGLGQPLEDRGAVLERAVLGHAERGGREVAVLGAEDGPQLGGPPDVELALLALAVGVQRRREPALLGPQLAQHPVAGLRGHPAGQLRAGAAPQVRVDPGEQGVVVEHLLEMRHDPAGVDRVPGEPAAELVVHATAGHRLAGGFGHRQRVGIPGPLVVAEQELQHHRRRELRRAAEPAPGRVVVAAQSLHRRGRRLTELGRAGLAPQGLGGGHRILGQRGGDLGGPVGHVVVVGAPGPGQVRDQLPEVRPRQVGAAEERLPGRGHDHRHRPAALAGHGLGRGHVDRVHVGPFLPVHLDRDHVLVQQRRRPGVFERLVRHDVAPVAGGVTHREQHRDVTPGRLGEGLVAPGPPVHRVVRVLEQVGTGRIPQPVHYFTVLRSGEDVPRAGWP